MSIQYWLASSRVKGLSLITYAYSIHDKKITSSFYGLDLESSWNCLVLDKSLMNALLESFTRLMASKVLRKVLKETKRKKLMALWLRHCYHEEKKKKKKHFFCTKFWTNMSSIKTTKKVIRNVTVPVYHPGTTCQCVYEYLGLTHHAVCAMNIYHNLSYCKKLFVSFCHLIISLWLMQNYFWLMVKKLGKQQFLYMNLGLLVNVYMNI